MFIIIDSQQNEMNEIESYAAGSALAAVGGNATSALCFGQDVKTQFRCAGDLAMLVLWVGVHLACVLFTKQMFGSDSIFREGTYDRWDDRWESRVRLLRTTFAEDHFQAPLVLPKPER